MLRWDVILDFLRLLVFITLLLRLRLVVFFLSAFNDNEFNVGGFLGNQNPEQVFRQRFHGRRLRFLRRRMIDGGLRRATVDVILGQLAICGAERDVAIHVGQMATRDLQN